MVRLNFDSSIAEHLRSEASQVLSKGTPYTISHKQVNQRCTVIPPQAFTMSTLCSCACGTPSSEKECGKSVFIPFLR